MKKKSYGFRSYRSWVKKHRKLPTSALTDPFLGVPVRINRNGRTIVFVEGRWLTFRPKKNKILAS